MSTQHASQVGDDVRRRDQAEGVSVEGDWPISARTFDWSSFIFAAQAS
ncbi:MAG: hypothetical protein LBK95_10115 [Bifidobacteriaceae bacterium]|nr:hypothetical protein [Bifidobacteriaceae bacterium]